MKTRSVGDWVTVSCLNCASDSVYSVQASSKLTTRYPVDLESLCQAGDQVLIHKDTVVCTRICYRNGVRAIREMMSHMPSSVRPSNRFHSKEDQFLKPFRHHAHVWRYSFGRRSRSGGSERNRYVLKLCKLWPSDWKVTHTGLQQSRESFTVSTNSCAKPSKTHLRTCVKRLRNVSRPIVKKKWQS